MLMTLMRQSCAMHEQILTWMQRSTTLSKMKFLKDQQTSLISFPKLARIGIHLRRHQNGCEIKNQERIVWLLERASRSETRRMTTVGETSSVLVFVCLIFFQPGVAWPNLNWKA
ncbi:hypothetical protein P5673_016421 [Acropora cervicornis]|uniref:Uncharacterized protein n=1 Tax=Acropora cervicornis TaxID=6130 RepID=A0AAD9QGT2_ACRCE|nr:hypothetical protein P5673_016421 [Acropora cervicornis]